VGWEDCGDGEVLRDREDLNLCFKDTRSIYARGQIKRFRER